MSPTTPSGLTALPTRTILVRSLAVLVATAVAVLGIVSWRWWDTSHRQERAAEALDAARTLTVQLLSYDAANLDADTAADRGLVTGDLAARFDDAVTPLAVQPGGRDPGTATRAEVVRAAVVSADLQQAVVLLFLDRVTTSAAAPERRDASQLAVTVTLDDGRWLVARLEPV